MHNVRFETSAKAKKDVEQVTEYTLYFILTFFFLHVMNLK